MTSNEPRLGFLEFGSSEEAHSICGLERAATSHAFLKLQRTSMLCMAGKKGYANQSSLQRSLEMSRGAQRRNSRTETHLGDKHLNIYCHLIQQITTHSQIRNKRNPSSKQNKTNPPSVLKPIFLADPQSLIFQKDCLLLNPRNTLTGI